MKKIKWTQTGFFKRGAKIGKKFEEDKAEVLKHGGKSKALITMVRVPGLVKLHLSSPTSLPFSLSFFPSVLQGTSPTTFVVISS
jgi:hypothetical protein